MKKIALTCAAAALALSGCNNASTTVTNVNNTLAALAKNDVPVACGIIHVAEGYFAAVKGLVPTGAVTAEGVAEATVAVICANPPTDIAGAFATLLNAWTTIQAATKTP